MATIVVAGALANRAGNGGGAWVRASWVKGFRRLGFQVVFVEQIAPETCRDESGAIVPLEASANLSYFKKTVGGFGLDSDSAALIYGGGREVHGIPWEHLLEIADSADLLVNISGHLQLEPLLRRCRRKAYIDIDPGFTQLWHEQGYSGTLLQSHDFHFTIGENIGTAECDIPTGGFRWRPIRQPVVLEDWPVVPAPEPRRFTTIASWRGAFAPMEHDGRKLGLKAHQFRRFVELPERCHERFEIALDIHPGDERDRAALIEHGWRVVDPRPLTKGLEEFRVYVQGSACEFSAAQGMYVDTMSGWFSDRSVRYLASGHPVLVQETGFDRHLPVGEGLLSFRTLDEAVRGAEEIMANHDHHSRMARKVAEECFDSDRVLSRFVEEVGL